MLQAKSNAAWLICLGMCAVLIMASLNPWHDWGGDFACYIMQAQAISQDRLTEFMAQNRSAILGSSIPIGPVAYPWGFPLLLAPLYAFWGTNLLALKAVGVVFLLLSLWMMKKLFENRLSTPFLLLLLACFALNKNYYMWGNQVLSDIPFLFFCLTAFFFMDRIFLLEGSKKTKLFDSFLLSICIFYAFCIRINGIALLPTLLFMHYHYWIRIRNGSYQEYNVILAVVPYLLFILFYFIWQAYFPYGGGTEASRLKDISLRDVLYNISYYFDVLKRFIPLRNENAAFFLYLSTIPLFIYGLVKRGAYSPHFIVFSIITIAIYLVWPAVQGYRFIFPVLPLYIYFVLSALEDISTKYSFFKSNNFLIIVIILIFSCFLLTIKIDLPEAKTNKGTPYSEPASEMFAYIKKETPTNAIILFFKPRVLRMLTQRQSFFIDKIHEIRGDYICAYKGKQWGPDFISLRELDTLEGSGKLIKLYENAEFSFFKIPKAL